MTDLLHQIGIKAPAAAVYDAIVDADGLRGWWTSDSVAVPRVGSVAEFGFGRRSTVFRMRIEELVPARRVVWACLGDPEEWAGTRLTWSLSVDADGTMLHFVHAGWRATDGMLAPCNSTWGELMHRLRDFAEGRRPGPHFHD